MRKMLNSVSIKPALNFQSTIKKTPYILGAPPSPERPVVSDIKDSQALVTWNEAPSSVEVTGYYIERKEKNTILWQRDNFRPITKNSYKIKSL